MLLGRLAKPGEHGASRQDTGAPPAVCAARTLAPSLRQLDGLHRGTHQLPLRRRLAPAPLLLPCTPQAPPLLLLGVHGRYEPLAQRGGQAQPLGCGSGGECPQRQGSSPG